MKFIHILLTILLFMSGSAWAHESSIEGRSEALREQERTRIEKIAMERERRLKDLEFRDPSTSLLPRVNALGQYVLLVPEVTSLVNDVKSMSSNFLIDNMSISSIPRNSRALLERHSQWMQETGVKIDAGRSAIDTILDIISYKLSMEYIGSFEKNCQSDQMLSQAEERFVADLSVVQQAIGLLKVRVESVGSNLGKSELRSIGDPDFVTNLSNVSNDLDTYSASQIAIKSQIMAQASKRRLICQEIPKAWRDIADHKIRQVNGKAAESLISDLKNALRGPEVYALVVASASNAIAMVDQSLNQYSPIHAQRSYLSASAQIQDLRSTLAAAAINDDMRARGNIAVDDFQRKLAIRQGAVQDQITRKLALGKERQRQTRLISTRLAQNFTAECTSLSQKILSPALAADGAQSEDLFIEFKGNCQSHGGTGQ